MISSNSVPKKLPHVRANSMPASPCQSNPVEITPERKDAFREFILSLPRECSPTICGIVAPPSTVEGSQDGGSHNKSASAMDISLSATDNSLNVNNETNKQCIWSIDEYAELYGADFDNVHEIDHFNEYESEQLSNHFIDESDRFFSQPSINPSPGHPSFVPSGAGQSLEKNKESISRSTGSFIRYIDSLQSNSTTSTAVVLNTNASSLEDYPVDETSDDQVDSGNFNSNKSDSTSDGAMTPTKKGIQKRISFVDSDFVSGTTMDISFGTTTTSGILCGGFSKGESNDPQFRYSPYLDFSPISPISRRPPLVPLQTNQAGQCGGSQAPMSMPMSSFGSHLSLNDFENISPIVPVGQQQSKFTPVMQQFEGAASSHGQQTIISAAATADSTPIGPQVASPMSMSIDDAGEDLSAIYSPAKTVQPSALASNTERQGLLSQQHWDAAFEQIPGHSLCNDAVFKTPASKPARKRHVNRRTKLVFSECTSTPN